MVKTQIAAKSPKPFLKWVGGKSKLAGELQALMPVSYNKFYEPFLGGGALFFHVQPTEAVISDINKSLIGAYQNIKNRPEELIDCLAKTQNAYYQKDEEARREFYYQSRSEYNSIADPFTLRKSCLLIMLNKTCYNGMYRENSRGEFNVPFGSYKQPVICDKATIIADSQLLQSADIQTVSFEAAIADAQKGDFIYFDPPYYPLSPTANFTSYFETPFLEKEQIKLKSIFDKLHKKGCYVMLSNSSTEFVNNLYADYRQEHLFVSRSINSKATGRGKIKELLILNY